MFSGVVIHGVAVGDHRGVIKIFAFGVSALNVVVVDYVFLQWRFFVNWNIKKRPTDPRLPND